ncbi:MAG: alpha-L-fucosidase [Planctomycetota bacterium]|nr:alpha-L-fucosidase [Planctomycetota bacterium]
MSDITGTGIKERTPDQASAIGDVRGWTRREAIQTSLASAAGLMGVSALAKGAGARVREPGANHAGDASGQARAASAGPVPLPRVAAFERMAFGMFVHWGLYSQMGVGEWVMNNRKIPSEEYLKLMATFKAESFSGRELARVAASAGCRYVTLTSRHHEGFSLYDTRGLSKLDVTNTPCGRDLIADFVEGCRAEGVVPMLYHTTLDWNEPRFKSDFPAYLQYLRDSVEILCTNYGPIGGFWFDGNWSKPSDDWQEDQLYAVIRKHQPETLIINNTGLEGRGKLGNPEIDSVTFEAGRPTPMDRTGHTKYVAAETCHTMNFHWGRAEADFNYLSPAHVIEELCICRGAGANLLMNIGPLASGAVPAYERGLMERVGAWVRMQGGNEGPIYNARPAGIVGEDGDFGLLAPAGNEAFLFVFGLTRTSGGRTHNPHKGPGKRAFSNIPAQFTRASWLDNGQELKLERDAERRLILDASGYASGVNMVVRIAKLTA